MTTGLLASSAAIIDAIKKLTISQPTANLKPTKLFNLSVVLGQKNLFLGDRKMQYRTNLFVLICCAGLVCFIFTPAAIAEESVSPDQATEKNAPTFPYIATITGDNVKIRCGPGTNYYPCGELNKTDTVKVVSHKYSWSRIVPPAGSFSWISTRYVAVDANDPTVGIVTGDNVRVWAGSAQLKPIHSTESQVKLKKSEKVKLLGEEKGDYYKIVPPQGVYLWVSTQYTELLGPIEQPPELIVPQPTKPTKPTKPTGPVAVVTTKISTEATKLEDYYALEEQIHAERTKPMDQQDYSSIKKALGEIAADKEAGKAARYCDFALKQIERYELVLQVARAVALQDTQLKQAKHRIEKALAARLAEVPRLGGFAVVGKFQVSSIYGTQTQPRHYQIIDDSGKIACFALPSGSASNVDLSGFINHRVGLVGTIEAYPQTAGALVRFTEITKLR